MDGEISSGEVEQLIAGDEDVRVVDIRNEGSFAREHIPGSENVPFERLPDWVDRLAGADRIVTVCPHGKASVQAAKLIKSYEGTADATVESMAGGITEWEGDLSSASGPDASGDGAADEGPDAPF
ncbi:rhodanese-like domain-containing protein [Candidatus Halobonum tyrrellensis]|uniref:Rhodanese-related sulfurtransferase n=1 Tax=Candidatus Halobonum tyrrellensis G22 TaxID=1324957 RepID=V4HB78_9EURY|nr:rhodanese-like domain-containing protein [Candidatus Halobonum tyrrellensis]ESP87288.1 rhodanese-related sulfurtransferase [Candidatus Halobonum tyrrellensis G22]